MNEIISAWLPDEKSTEYFRVCIFVWFGKKQKRERVSLKNFKGEAQKNATSPLIVEKCLSLLLPKTKR